ncbi:MAG: HD domain-containing protein [Candidatus Abyssobacteria bacterium SURF_17]|uniref:HD domain-containing protein n=1 Tax=Candidatus Abyssobacteria bacterium SURF_17 TaxID=2093361 RepID=A0A419ETU9_9BACT|nr:MAG: HD domain-containing protein [Candidatus Abyssubacteria bacterium SURF_17]
MPDFSKNSVTAAMQNVFGDDQKRISHALSVLTFAERILQGENADSDIVIAAALLHDIGIQEAERKYGSNAGHYQEIEGPPIAERILESLGSRPEFITEVCDIIAHHHSPRENESLNYKVLYDADLIVNLRDDVPPERRAALSEKMKKMFFTSTGLKLARKTLLGKSA